MGKHTKDESNRPNKIMIPYRAAKRSIHPKGWVATIQRKVRKQTKQVLWYTGIEDIEINGSFLADALKITNLPVADMIEILDMSKSTFYRAQKSEVLEMETVDKLSSLFKIYQQGSEAFESQDTFEAWLHSKIVNLGNQKPLDLIKTENGRAIVRDAINRIEYGIYG